MKQKKKSKEINRNNNRIKISNNNNNNLETADFAEDRTKISAVQNQWTGVEPFPEELFGVYKQSQGKQSPASVQYWYWVQSSTAISQV